METDFDSAEQAIFTAEDLRLAAEQSSNPQQFCRAASWAIKTAQDTGVSPEFSSEYFLAVARRFQ